MRILIAALSGLLMASQAAFAEQPKLFKDWAYKTPMASFSQELGFYDCAADFGAKAVCIDDVEFLGYPFGAVLSPTEGSLAEVMLVAEFDYDLYVKLMGALAGGFTLISMPGANDQLDLLHALQVSRNSQQFQSRLNDYETLGLSQGQLTYTFIEQSGDVVRRFSTASAAAFAAPETARLAELVVYEDEYESTLLVKFSLPTLSRESARESMQRMPVEDF